MKSDAKFSDKAIGVISNHGDQHFSEFQLALFRGDGIGRFVYLGPLARLDNWRELVELMASDMGWWVYGRSESLEHGVRRVGMGAQSVRTTTEFSPGETEFVWHDILFRYFLPGGDTNELLSVFELTGAPAYLSKDVLVSLGRLARKSEARILVIGSGFYFEHWIMDVDSGILMLREKDKYESTSFVEGPVDLELGCKHIIVHPTFRWHRCSVIDPQQNRMVIYSTME